MKKLFLLLFFLLWVGVIFAAEHQVELLEVKDPGFVKLGGYKKPPAYFSHDLHVSLYRIKCKYCHHQFVNGKNVWSKDKPIQACSKCHGQNRRQLILAYHNLCFNCHKRLRALSPEADAPVYQCNRCHLPNLEAVKAEEKRITNKLKHRKKQVLELINKIEQGGLVK